MLGARASKQLVLGRLDRNLSYACLAGRQWDRWHGRESSAAAPLRSANELVAVQTGAALAAGCTSATLTNPLDVIKTRLQVWSSLVSGP